MNEADLARVLIERAASGDPKVDVVANRVLLQLHSVPSMETYLTNAGTRPTDDGTGSYVIELDFYRLPEEILPQVEKLLAAHQFREKKWTKYVLNGQAHTGLTLTVHPDDLPGDAYTYAY